MRIVTGLWREAHPEEVLESALNARRHVKKRFTKPHQNVKAALIAAGLDGFITECEVGYYSIDEARPDLLLAVEVEGCYYHGCSDCGFPGLAGTILNDRRRATYLTNRGWTILRLLEHEVRADLEGCVRKVRVVVEALSKRGAA
jgi:very-short-patch-repair endonuclease